MKHLFALVFFSLFTCCLHAQAVDATVCDILNNPASFNGKIVRIKGTVSASFDRFTIEGPTCGHEVNGIWLSYPDGTKGKAGPVAVVELQPAHNFAGTIDAPTRTPVTLEKTKEFKQFDSLLAAQFKENSMCLGCSRNRVNATLVGRLDGVDSAELRRDSKGKVTGWTGFGNLNAYSARLVLQSVSDVVPQEIDYSKAAATTKADSFDSSATVDALAAAHSGAKVFGAANPAGEQVERAAAAFGKPGEKNGVLIIHGIANEVPKEEGVKSALDSPDGVIYNCTFHLDRLEGDALTKAIVYSGTLVAQLRNPMPGTENDRLFELEYRAWAATSFIAVASGQKTLTTFGGHILWNSAWTDANRTQNLNDAIRAVLADDGVAMQ